MALQKSIVLSLWVGLSSATRETAVGQLHLGTVDESEGNFCASYQVTMQYAQCNLYGGRDLIQYCVGIVEERFSMSQAVMSLKKDKCVHCSDAEMDERCSLLLARKTSATKEVCVAALKSYVDSFSLRSYIEANGVKAKNYMAGAGCSTFEGFLEVASKPDRTFVTGPVGTQMEGCYAPTGNLVATLCDAYPKVCGEDKSAASWTYGEFTCATEFQAPEAPDNSGPLWETYKAAQQWKELVPNGPAQECLKAGYSTLQAPKGKRYMIDTGCKGEFLDFASEMGKASIYDDNAKCTESPGNILYVTCRLFNKVCGQGMSDKSLFDVEPVVWSGTVGDGGETYSCQGAVFG